MFCNHSNFLSEKILLKRKKKEFVSGEDLLKWGTGSQIGFSEDNGVERFLLILEEENPKPIIGNKGLPKLADDAHLSSFFWTKQSQNLDQYIRRYVIECS